MSVYIALLRGINVGGKTMIKMANLISCLEKAGFKEVSTYIQSGNIIFCSNETNTHELTKIIENAVLKQFGLAVPALVITDKSFKEIIKSVPADWGQNSDWKYNLLFLLPRYDMEQVTQDIGELKPDIETLTIGRGVLYQTLSIKVLGRATTGKLASKPVYKRITVRNYRTCKKLLEILEKKVGSF